MENQNNYNNYYNNNAGSYGNSGNTGYNPYGPYSYAYAAVKHEIKDPFINRESRHITKLSLLAGAALLSFIVLQEIMVLLLSVFGLSELYLSNYSFQLIFGTLCSVICVFVPFTVVYGFYSEGDKEKCFEFGAPVSSKAFLLAVSAGIMFCLVSDYISSGFNTFVGSFGVSFVDIETKSPSNAAEFLLMVLECAVVPALAEEFAIRGVVMQPLRRYGDRFAIVMSSVIFAVMHGNMMQIPFALFAGLALGYFAVSTGSIWTSVAIHFANNLFSVILVSVNSESVIEGFAASAVVAALIIGGIVSLYFFIKTDHIGLGLTRGAKTERLFLICSFIIFVMVSVISSLTGKMAAILYLGFAAAVAVFYALYRNTNRKAAGAVRMTGLSGKLMASLYIGSPTLLLAGYSLVIMTVNMVSLDELGSYLFCLVLFLIYFAVSIISVSSVYSSRLLENKKPYTISIFMLAVSGLFTLIFLLLIKFSVIV